MDSCPKCRSRKVHRSRTRSGLERLRRTLTGKAPFRCGECGWRGRAFDFGDVNHAGSVAVTTGDEPDLHAIDREMADRKA